MDNQRPQLDLKFYKDICPDRNGALLRTLMIIFNSSLRSSRHRGVYQIRPVPAECGNAFAGFPK